MVGETRYFGGAGQQTLDSQGAVASRKYLHGDLIDSNVMTTNENGVAQATTAYTAFGEAISWHAGAASPGLPDDSEALGTRYQYAGAWGYEAPTAIDYSPGGGGGSGTAPFSEGPGLTLRGVNPLLPPITLSHVGARWYQPAVGRFVQRDPIGLSGGNNLYVYISNAPGSSVDPAGTNPIMIYKWTKKGVHWVWEEIKKRQAIRASKRGNEQIKVVGDGSSQVAKQIVEEAHGKGNALKHTRHDPGNPHYQPLHRDPGDTIGHVWYDCITPPDIIGELKRWVDEQMEKLRRPDIYGPGGPMHFD